MLADALSYYREEEEDCPVCFGMGMVENSMWTAFFAERPDIADAIYKYFGTRDLTRLPPLSSLCPACSHHVVSDDFDDFDDWVDEIDNIPF